MRQLNIFFSRTTLMCPTLHFCLYFRAPLTQYSQHKLVGQSLNIISEIIMLKTYICIHKMKHTT